MTFKEYSVPAEQADNGVDQQGVMVVSSIPGLEITDRVRLPEASLEFGDTLNGVRSALRTHKIAPLLRTALERATPPDHTAESEELQRLTEPMTRAIIADNGIQSGKDYPAIAPIIPSDQRDVVLRLLTDVQGETERGKIPPGVLRLLKQTFESVYCDARKSEAGDGIPEQLHAPTRNIFGKTQLEPESIQDIQDAVGRGKDALAVCIGDIPAPFSDGLKADVLRVDTAVEKLRAGDPDIHPCDLLLSTRRLEETCCRIPSAVLGEPIRRAIEEVSQCVQSQLGEPYASVNKTVLDMVDGKIPSSVANGSNIPINSPDVKILLHDSAFPISTYMYRKPDGSTATETSPGVLHEGLLPLLQKSVRAAARQVAAIQLLEGERVLTPDDAFRSFQDISRLCGIEPAENPFAGSVDSVSPQEIIGSLGRTFSTMELTHATQHLPNKHFAAVSAAIAAGIVSGLDHAPQSEQEKIFNVLNGNYSPVSGAYSREFQDIGHIIEAMRSVSVIWRKPADFACVRERALRNPDTAILLQDLSPGLRGVPSSTAKILVSAISNQLKVLDAGKQSPFEAGDHDMRKLTPLVVGPTGSGKTSSVRFLMEEIVEQMNIGPEYFVKIFPRNCGQLVNEGIVGPKVLGPVEEAIGEIQRRYRCAPQAAAEIFNNSGTAILLLDEFERVAIPSGREDQQAGVRQQILDLTDPHPGTRTVSVLMPPQTIGSPSIPVEVRLDRIGVICAGAFSNPDTLEKAYRKNRLDGRPETGVTDAESAIAAGMDPALAARMVWAPMSAPDEDMLRYVLSGFKDKSRNPLKSVRAVAMEQFRNKGCQLSGVQFDEGVPSFVARLLALYLPNKNYRVFEPLMPAAQAYFEDLLRNAGQLSGTSGQYVITVPIMKSIMEHYHI